MRKILYVPIIAALGLFMIPGLYYNGYIPATVESVGLSPIMDESELYSQSEISLEGRIIGQTTDVTFVRNGDLDVPYVYTTWTLLTKDSLKGAIPEKVEFKTSGGTYKNIEHVNIHSPEMNIGDDVIVFLSLDEDSEWGDSYYLTGIESGIYTIDENGNAKNDLRDVNINIDDLKSQIRSFER